MSTKRDYYEILGINKNASADEIKQAYRKLALQWHPDRVDASKKKEAEEKFKEISEAYAVLSDAQKRTQYDQFGHQGIDSRYSTEDIFKGADFGDLFDNMGFGNLFGDSVFGDIFSSGSRGAGRTSRGRDLEYHMRIFLRDAFFGKEEKISVSHQDICPTCSGEGMKPGTKKKICTQCRGAGEVRYSQGFFSISQPCPKCHGQGEIIDTPCPECRGQGRVKKTKLITVKIPPGVNTGSVLRLRGEGEAGIKRGSPGDLYVVIEVASDPVFKRVNDDLYCDISISFTQAALGSEIIVPAIEGNVAMKIPAGTQNGKLFRLKGKGMTHLQQGGKGDEYVRVNIQVPTTLSKQEKEMLLQFAKTRGEKI